MFRSPMQNALFERTIQYQTTQCREKLTGLNIKNKIRIKPILSNKFKRIVFEFKYIPYRF